MTSWILEFAKTKNMEKKITENKIEMCFYDEWIYLAKNDGPKAKNNTKFMSDCIDLTGKSTFATTAASSSRSLWISAKIDRTICSLTTIIAAWMIVITFSLRDFSTLLGIVNRWMTSIVVALTMIVCVVVARWRCWRLGWAIRQVTCWACN